MVLPVATVTVVKVVSALPEFVIGALSPFIVTELALSRTVFGVLPSVYFVVASALSLTAGSRVDRHGMHATLSAQLAFGLGGLLMLAMAPNFWMLAVAMMFGGIGASIASPVSNKVIALRVARRAQGIAMGINQSGIQIATLVAGAVLPPVAAVFGWRVAIAVITPVPVLGLVLAWFGFRQRNPIQAGTQVTDDGEDSARPDGFVAWFAGFAFLMGSGISGVTAFVALFAFEVVDVPPGRAGTIMVALGVTGAASRIVWGHAVGKMDRPWRLLPYFALVAALSTSLFAVSPQVGEPLIWVAALLFGSGAAAWSPVIHLSLVRLLGPDALGRGSGGVQSAFFFGMIVSPMIFGITTDQLGYEAAWIVLTVVFVAAGALAITWLTRMRRLTRA